MQEFITVKYVISHQKLDFLFNHLRFFYDVLMPMKHLAASSLLRSLGKNILGNYEWEIIAQYINNYRTS